MKRLLTILAVISLLAAAPAIVAAADEMFSASLSGDQEVPPVTTSATGTASVTISDDESTISYSVTYSGLSGDLAAAHIHLGAKGTNGGVLFPLAHGPSPFDGTLTSADFTATGDVDTYDKALDAIRAGDTYVNLHTAANPGGEIRGQLANVLDTTTDDPVGFPVSPALIVAAVFALAAAGLFLRPVARAR
jgi:hypothetical protein